MWCLSHCYFLAEGFSILARLLIAGSFVTADIMLDAFHTLFCAIP